MAVFVVALVAAGYGLWQWSARPSTEAGARLIAQGEYRAAIRALQEPLAAAPGDARVQYYLGRAYAGAGALDGAINRLREAVRLAPRQAPYRVALAQAYRDTGDVVRARDELEEAVRLAPGEPRYEGSLAGVMLEQGQTDAALAHLRHAVTTAPRDAELRLLLAQALRQAGAGADMAREYREAIRLAADRTLAEAARQELRSALGPFAGGPRSDLPARFRSVPRDATADVATARPRPGE